MEAYEIPIEPNPCEESIQDDWIDKIPEDILKNIQDQSREFYNHQKELVAKTKLRKFTTKQRRAFTAEVITHARRMELQSYQLCIKWKKQFRYDLVADFRNVVSSIRRNLIKAYLIDKQFIWNKIYFYNQAQCELAELEAVMWLMIQPNINIMSNKQWAEFAYEVDTISRMVENLINSLKRSEPESNG